MTDRPSPWWMRTRHQDRRGFLAARAQILAAIRAWFADAGFMEADVGALATSPGGETHVEGFETAGLYLHTSPEFAMKKLLSAGEERIFFLGKVYRAGERGPLHAPEFTMLEWYRAGAPWKAVAADALEIARCAARAIGAAALHRGDAVCDPFLEAKPITVSDAWTLGRQTGSIHLKNTMSAEGEPDRDRLAEEISQSLGPGFRIVDDDTWSDLFSRVMKDSVEPWLRGFSEGRAVLLHDYPAPEAAFSQRCGDRRFAERFELYACGVELANGYGELTDPEEQRRRLEAAMAEKERRYRVRWPIDEDFLAALEHMPPASGCALGVDRLIMLATGAAHIEQVLWNPAPSPG